MAPSSPPESSPAPPSKHQDPNSRSPVQCRTGQCGICEYALNQVCKNTCPKGKLWAHNNFLWPPDYYFRRWWGQVTQQNLQTKWQEIRASEKAINTDLKQMWLESHCWGRKVFHSICQGSATWYRAPGGADEPQPSLPPPPPSGSPSRALRMSAEPWAFIQYRVVFPLFKKSICLDFPDYQNLSP